MDESKIRGNISDDLREEALSQYINENYNALLKPFLVQKRWKQKEIHSRYCYKRDKTEVNFSLFLAFCLIFRPIYPSKRPFSTPTGRGFFIFHNRSISWTYDN